ncbi:thermonuclease family protein [Candidatus Pacearchaeota archaeon]|nr:thermonuclease family protein [Candidatus Pacearchaeota archaeon]
MVFGKRLLMFLLIIILLGILAYYYPYLTGNATNNQQQTNYQKEPAFVTKVIDGDTIKAEIDGTEYSIRLLGINTPEKGMPYSKEAVKFLKSLEEKNVELLRDKENTDRYNRKLRYVFYKENLINAEILQKGLATSFMLNELKYETKLKDAENFAIKNKIGIWKESGEVCAFCVELSELNPENEYFIIKNSCDFSCNLTGWVVKDDANHFFYLAYIGAFEELRYNSKIDIWNNEGDRFFMRDNNGDLVIFWEYVNKTL